MRQAPHDHPIGTPVRRASLKIGKTTTTKEPGGLVRENQLRNRFAHLLAFGREWFHPGPDLIAYINELRAADDLPALTE